MAPLSYTAVIIQQYPALSRPSCTQFGYLPLVGIAVVILVLIASCGDDAAPVGPRRQPPSVSPSYIDVIQGTVEPD